MYVFAAKVMGKRKKQKKFKSTTEIANHYADELRNKLTKAEKYFKTLLQKAGVLFKSQKIVYKQKSFYISDFYIKSKNLHIELDGGYHNEPEQMQKDKERDEFLIKSGYAVWRMTNEDALSMTVEGLLSKLSEYPDRPKNSIRVLATAEEKPKYYPKKKYGNPRPSKKKSKPSKKLVKDTEERMRILQKMRDEKLGIYADKPPRKRK